MNVILADVLGYCMGVRRAVDSAIETLKNNQNNKVYSLGPLIHNQVALDKLSSMGLKVLREPNIDLLDERTCPRVLDSQNNAKRYSSMNYTVILAGDKNHGEVVGIAGYAGKKVILVENKKDAEKLPSFNDDENAVLLCQTTFSMEEFKQIAARSLTASETTLYSSSLGAIVKTILGELPKRNSEAFDVVPKEFQKYEM